ncbi:hypothetical protein MJL22_27330, partial [Salmonella enterica subsp. enterica serovar Montevideo]|nr:hypothetical protein [Salmonella enterica subsp. enterica serovar Montevideo]
EGSVFETIEQHGRELINKGYAHLIEVDNSAQPEQPEQPEQPDPNKIMPLRLQQAIRARYWSRHCAF